MKTQSNKMQTRDFISAGIFSLIYAVVAFVIGGIAQITPMTFPFMPMAVALFSGTIFMLYVAKIPKKGSLIILGIIAGILIFIAGMFWLMAALFVVLGFVADFICASGAYKSFRKNLMAYCVFALSPLGGYLPIALMPAQFDEFMSSKGDFSSFAEVVNSIGANWWALPLMVLGTVLCAIIGGLIGKKLMKKHFVKAGIA